MRSFFCPLALMSAITAGSTLVWKTSSCGGLRKKLVSLVVTTSKRRDKSVRLFAQLRFAASLALSLLNL